MTWKPSPAVTWLVFVFRRFKCRRCVNNSQVRPPPDGSDCSADLSQWHHSSDPKGLEDILLKGAWSSGVTFVFHHKSHDKQLGLWLVTKRMLYTQANSLWYRDTLILLPQLIFKGLAHKLTDQGYLAEEHCSLNYTFYIQRFNWIMNCPLLQ